MAERFRGICCGIPRNSADSAAANHGSEKMSEKYGFGPWTYFIYIRYRFKKALPKTRGHRISLSRRKKIHNVAWWLRIWAEFRGFSAESAENLLSASATEKF